jgi:hypothetical protein
MRLQHSIFLLLAVVSLLTVQTVEAGSVREQALAFAAPRFELEDLTAEVQGDGRVIHVSGKIRNHSHAPVKGYVVIYYRNANNEPLHAVEAEVNQKQAFDHGEAGFFEATANIEQVSGVASVSVEFVDQPTPLKNARPKK